MNWREENMRKLTIRLQDELGNVQEEKEIQVNENEMLIMKYPKDMSLDTAHHCYKGLKEALEEGFNVIGLPDSLSFQVIKVQ